MAAKRGLAKQKSRVTKAVIDAIGKRLSATVRSHVLGVLGLNQNVRIEINFVNRLRLFSIILVVSVMIWIMLSAA